MEASWLARAVWRVSVYGEGGDSAPDIQVPLIFCPFNPIRIFHFDRDGPWDTSQSVYRNVVVPIYVEDTVHGKGPYTTFPLALNPRATLYSGFKPERFIITRQVATESGIDELKEVRPPHPP